MLYRSTDRLCRSGAPMENLCHSASFESDEKNAPSKSGTKHLDRSAQPATPRRSSDVLESVPANDGTNYSRLRPRPPPCASPAPRWVELRRAPAESAATERLDRRSDLDGRASDRSSAAFGPWPLSSRPTLSFAHRRGTYRPATHHAHPR